MKKRMEQFTSLTLGLEDKPEVLSRKSVFKVLLLYNSQTGKKQTGKTASKNFPPLND